MAGFVDTPRVPFRIRSRIFKFLGAEARRQRQRRMGSAARGRAPSESDTEQRPVSPANAGRTRLLDIASPTPMVAVLRGRA